MTEPYRSEQKITLSRQTIIRRAEQANAIQKAQELQKVQQDRSKP